MKAIYLSLGVLFGVAFGILPMAWDSSHHMEICIRLYGPLGGILFALLPVLPVSIIAATFFGWVGYRFGRGLEYAAARRSRQEVGEAVKDTESVWPPPPKSSLKEPHDVT